MEPEVRKRSGGPFGLVSSKLGDAVYQGRTGGSGVSGRARGSSVRR